MKGIKIRIYHFLPHYGFSIIAALVLGIISWYVYFSQTLTKYETKVFDDLECTKKAKDFYDLNNDGEAESLYLSNQKDLDGRCFLTISTHPFNDRKVVSQTNWDYSVTMFSRINVCDYDNDGIKEVFIILRDDSLLRLIGLKPVFDSRKDAIILFDKAITNVHITKKGFEDFYLYPFCFADLNNDGVKEVIFTVNGGYAAHPRKVYYYDIINDSLHQSPDNLSIQYNYISCTKIDGQYYFLPKTVSSPGNVNDTLSIKYNDWSDWVYLFNQSLKPAFPPIRLSPGYGSFNYQQFVKYKGKTRFLSLNNKNYFGKSLALYSTDGKLLKKKLLKERLEYKLFNSIDTSKYLATIIYGNNIGFLNKNFKIKKQFTIPDVAKKRVSNIIIDNFDSDHQMEYLINTDFNKKLNLFDDNFKLIFSYPLSHSIVMKDAHLIISKSNYHMIWIRYENRCLIIGYKFNKNFYLSYLFAAITSLVLFILFQLAIRQRLRFVEKQHNIEKHLIESQLKIANRQMSPHFQLNVLNSISYLFETDKEKAQYYLGKYSRLVVQIMMNVDKISITLENELSFAKNYLILEQHRLGNRFDFIFELEDKIDTAIMIPRMLIFTFVENAIKHGLYHKKEHGLLKIKGEQKGKEIIFIIEDNGIGRKKAKERQTSGTGMGLKTLGSIVKYFNENNKTKIAFSIIDKENGGGLKVVLTIKIG